MILIIYYVTIEENHRGILLKECDELEKKRQRGYRNKRINGDY